MRIVHVAKGEIYRSAKEKKRGKKEVESRKSSPDSGLGKGSGVKGQWSAPPILW